MIRFDWLSLKSSRKMGSIAIKVHIAFSFAFRYIASMGDRKDTDQWENVESAPHRAVLDTNLVTTLPTGEPAPSIENERQNLIETIGDLENTLKFMGKLHPQRENLDKRLSTLKAMLKQIDDELDKG